jgi:hypothetical protein
MTPLLRGEPVTGPSFLIFLQYWGFELRASCLLGSALPLEPLRQPGPGVLVALVF